MNLETSKEQSLETRISELEKIIGLFNNVINNVQDEITCKYIDYMIDKNSMTLEQLKEAISELLPYVQEELNNINGTERRI